MGEQVEMLEHHAHFLPVEVDVHLGVRDVHAVKDDGAPGGPLQQVEAPQEGGFPGPGGPDDHHDLPTADVRGHAVEGPDGPAVKVLLQVPDLDQYVLTAHCFSTSSPAGP